MSWKPSIKQAPANDIFSVLGVRFEYNKLEGVWLAFKEEKVLRRPSLTKACQAVLEEWVKPI
ncbi:MAG: hypothetical protein SWY16_04505 [Cyanobacteriota bacterium]|nr:hypothetical protein [Cyanobacteriota bacterium]